MKLIIHVILNLVCNEILVITKFKLWTIYFVAAEVHCIGIRTCEEKSVEGHDT